MKSWICGILSLLLIFSLIPTARAQEMAGDITAEVQITGTGYKTAISSPTVSRVLTTHPQATHL